MFPQFYLAFRWRVSRQAWGQGRTWAPRRHCRGCSRSSARHGHHTGRATSTKIQKILKLKYYFHRNDRKMVAYSRDLKDMTMSVK